MKVSASIEKKSSSPAHHEKHQGGAFFKRRSIGYKTGVFSNVVPNAVTIRPDLARNAREVNYSVDLTAELEESRREAISAIDNTPAEKARKDVLKIKPEKRFSIRTEAKTEDGKTSKEKRDNIELTGHIEKPKLPLVYPEVKETFPVGEAGRYLKEKSTDASKKALMKTGILAANEKRHNPAETKLKQAVASVKTPAEEGHAKSSAEQVYSLNKTPAPSLDEEAPKKTLTSSIDETTPKTLQEMNEFRSKGKAKVVGNLVMADVRENTGKVNETYGIIEVTPPAIEAEYSATELPELEKAGNTPVLNLGKNAVPGLKKEHTDFSGYQRQSDEIMKREGITDEQLNMVDEGELFEAKKGRQTLKKDVIEQPVAIKEFANREIIKIEDDLLQEEKSSRKDMHAKRINELSMTKEKQIKTKKALEQKREAVAKKINGIYKNVRTVIMVRLENLEKDSLNKFDKGQESASKEFEDEVNHDINVWKERRYSGIFGPAKWVKDKLFGIEDFPEVKAAFIKARNNYIKKIELLIADITRESNKVVSDCKAELSRAAEEIKKIVDNLGPELKAEGLKSLKEMKANLDEMDRFIDRKKERLSKRLCDKKDQAIKKIDEKIEKMKEQMSGVLSKLGKLLLDALLKFFRWVLKKAGYDEKQLMSVIDRGKAVIKKIVGDPAGFLRNIVNAVKTGINNFVANIKRYLIEGFVGWLTGAMSDIGIQLPERFDLKGIISIVLHVLGLTWNIIRYKLVKRLGEKVVSTVEKTVDIVRRLVTDGPMALWEMIKEKAQEIKEKVMEGIRSWVIVEIVKQAVIKLLSFLNPVGALIQAILAIYNTVMFFVENWRRIVEFVKTVFNSIADIAMGKISAAAAAVEKSMAMTIPIILNFLARLLNISGIGKAVRNIIEKIRIPVDNVIDKAIDFIANIAGRLIAKIEGVSEKVRGKVEAAKEKVFEWWKAKRRFTDDRGEGHQIYFEGREKSARLMIASTPQTYESFIKMIKTTAPEEIEAKGRALAIARKIDNLKEKTIIDKSGTREQSTEFSRLLEQLAEQTKVFMGRTDELPVTTPPVYGGIENGFGKSVYIEKLTRLGPPGSKPAVTNRNWEILSERRAGGGSYYIRGHLLNMKLHGSGTTWLNLTPLSRSGNALHESWVESKVKEAVSKNHVVQYKVEAKYKRSLNTSLLDHIKRSSDPLKIKKARIIEAEKFLPSSLICNAEKIDPKTGKSVKKEPLNIKNLEVPNRIDESAESYLVAK